MLILIRQGSIYLYKLNVMVEPRTGSEQIRDDIIKCIRFTDKGTEDQSSEVSSRLKMI